MQDNNEHRLIEQQLLSALIHGDSEAAGEFLFRLDDLSREAIEALALMLMKPSALDTIDRFYSPFRLVAKKRSDGHRPKRTILDMRVERVYVRRVARLVKEGMTKTAAIEQVRKTAKTRSETLHSKTIWNYCRRHKKLMPPKGPKI